MIREEIMSITILFHLGKLLYLLAICNKALYMQWPSSAIIVVFITVVCIIQRKMYLVL